MEGFLTVVLAVASVTGGAQAGDFRPRVREVGIIIGELPTGPINAITDVAGIRVGHCTLIVGDSVRTGVTVIMPHGGNLFQRKVPAALFVANGFGKLTGATQVEELGTIESPIALTNTLNVPRVADALIDYMLKLPGNEHVQSINVVVGETNDGRLNDIRGRHVRAEHVVAAIRAARSGPVEEGSVGAGTGTCCLGWKGGIGTASRRLNSDTVGVLVQTNFGGRLTIAGVPVWKYLAPPARAGNRARSNASESAVDGAGSHSGQESDSSGGSCMIVVATDAPLGPTLLRRLAFRAIAGMARTVASFSHGSGDYVVAFSTASRLTVGPTEVAPAGPADPLATKRLDRLLLAVAEATEEAILNSLFRATTISSRFGTVHALTVGEVVKLLKAHGAIGAPGS